jgi:hypothetical protein
LRGGDGFAEVDPNDPRLLHDLCSICCGFRRRCGGGRCPATVGPN